MDRNLLKTFIYISGLLSAFLFAGWIVAMVMKLPTHLYMLLAGTIVFFLIYLPLLTRKKRKHKERMKKIIETYKAKGSEDPIPDNSDQKIKGWDMNNSPFRDRSSGATWGGGNIHAANVTRGTRQRKK